MVPKPWLFYILAFTLRLPLLTTAIPTEPSPGHSTTSLDEILKEGPLYNLPNSGDHGQCTAVRWHGGDFGTSFMNHHDNFIVFVETVAGVVMCFVPSPDLDKMMPEKAILEDEYNTLFTHRLLSQDGDLSQSVRQLQVWSDEASQPSCGTPFVVFDIQIATRGSVGEPLTLHREIIGSKNDRGHKRQIQIRIGPHRHSAELENTGLYF